MNQEVKLPRAIQAEVDLAEQIERELQAAYAPPAPVAEDPNEEPVAEVQAPEEPAEENQQSVVSEEDPNSETWQSRYNVLQGKYNTEVPRYASQLRDVTARLQQAEEMLQRFVNSPPAQASHSDPDIDDRYKKAAEFLGEDVVDFTRDSIRAEIDKRLAEVAESQRQFDARLKQAEKDRFFNQLDVNIPGWRELDNDPAWLGWLQEYDPMLGAPRQAAINQGVANQDINLIVYMFNLFKSTRLTPPPSPVGNTPAPSRAQLEQVAPRPTGMASSPSTQQGRVYTEAEIHRLLDPRNLRKLPLEQQRAIEHDIDMAIAEGRVAA